MTFYCGCLLSNISSLTLIQKEFICWCRIISHGYTANYFRTAYPTLKPCGVKTWRCVVGASWRRSNGFVTHGDVSRQLPVRRATSFGHVNPVLIQLYWWWWAPKSWGKESTYTDTHMRRTQHHIQHPSFWQQVADRVTKSECFYHLVHKSCVSENNLALYERFSLSGVISMSADGPQHH